MKAVAALLVLAAALGGCDAFEPQHAADTEKVLAALGFERLAADSAERRQDLASLPPHRIVERRRDGSTVYLYADPQNCGCLYAGGPEAYAKYQQFEEREEIARSLTWNDL